MTERLCSSLEPEDFNLQSMPDASPAKWHIAHTSWFFERFVLARHAGTHGVSHQVFDERWEYLFNSYYNAVGERHCRARRGGLSRPTVGEVMRYRWHVDESVLALLDTPGVSDEALRLIELGLHHEQQHQELLVTDVLHGFWCNPLLPTLEAGEEPAAWCADPGAMGWVGFEEGVRRIGRDAGDGTGTGGGFGYDHEGPRHRVFVEAFELGDRLVTNGEYRAFIADGGYERPELWLDEGWRAARVGGWRGPLYWHDGERAGETDRASSPDGARDAESLSREFTPRGDREIDEHAPVCCVSLYEADAFARWSGCRLATEFEWECACGDRAVAGNLQESRHMRTRGVDRAGGDGDGVGDSGLRQMFGDCWEWTLSDYGPYPGYRAEAGALGEYNGKFMSGRHVLRGGSFATPGSHVRASYRNYWPAETRWQFAGIRLARSV